MKIVLMTGASLLVEADQWTENFEILTSFQWYLETKDRFSQAIAKVMKKQY